MPDKLGDLDADIAIISKLGYLPPDRRGDVDAIVLLRWLRSRVLFSFQDSTRAEGDMILRHACTHLYGRYGQLSANQLIPPARRIPVNMRLFVSLASGIPFLFANPNPN
jgi:hypothetical protein